jgi:hypothetical protein
MNGDEDGWIIAIVKQPPFWKKYHRTIIIGIISLICGGVLERALSFLLKGG